MKRYYINLSVRLKGSYHRREIGTRLFQILLRDASNGTITLHSSPLRTAVLSGVGVSGNRQGANGQRDSLYADGVPRKCGTGSFKLKTVVSNGQNQNFFY